MSRTFTKLFSSITESTVWCEPDGTRLVWICMLAMADRNGRVWGSVPGLANRARVAVEATRKAIETFMAPDPDSRTPDFDGRRIEVIDGGWRLLNHEKYRAIRDEESTLEAKRKYINARRAADKAAKEAAALQDVEQSRSRSNTVDRSRDNAEAEAEAEAKTKTLSTPVGVSPRKRGSSGSEGFDLFWVAYPKKKAKPVALKAFCRLSPSSELLDEMLHAIAKQRMSSDWADEGGKYIPHPATWINEGRWQDEGTDMPATRHETPAQSAKIDRAIELSGGILNTRRARQPDYIDATTDFPALG